MHWVLPVAGLIAGFIDAIAGGGGLISLPVLILALGHSIEAIGTNKIVGFVGAFVALLVYRRRGHLDWRKGVAFTAWVTVGALIGSSIAPWISDAAVRWTILGIGPVLIWVVWKKDFLIVREIQEKRHALHESFEPALVVSGLLCGTYDGAIGPGGGTFMFFALLSVVKLPLLTAIAVTKLSNTFSAGTALVRYGIRGNVHWAEGCLMAVGMGTGAFLGARVASERAAQIVKPVFTVVVILLLLRIQFR